MTTKVKNLAQFRSEFPLLLTSRSRPNCFDLIKTSPIEKYLLMPMRKILVKIASDSFVNNRFGIGYVPNEFTRGCERAIPVFFNTLQDISANVKQKLKAKTTLENTEADSKDHSKTTNKDSDAAKVKPSKIITAALHADLEQFIHDLYQHHGLEFKINLISVNNIKNVENHLAFGPSMYSTLSIAPITVKLAPMVYKRKYRTGYLFKEMNFEYYIPESDATDESTPTLNDRLEMTRQNVVVAIVVEANLDFNFALEKDGNSMYSEQFTRNVLFRLETEPFVGRDVGQFKIADVDNYFASALIPSLKD